MKLADLLDEAEARAFKIVSDKNPDLPEAQRRDIARAVGIGAVKYADLLPNRQGDYDFQLGQDARAQRQHGAVFAIRLHAD